jgi:hypothetical protein
MHLSSFSLSHIRTYTHTHTAAALADLVCGPDQPCGPGPAAAAAAVQQHHWLLQPIQPGVYVRVYVCDSVSTCGCRSVPTFPIHSFNYNAPHYTPHYTTPHTAEPHADTERAPHDQLGQQHFHCIRTVSYALGGHCSRFHAAGRWSVCVCVREYACMCLCVCEDVRV